MMDGEKCLMAGPGYPNPLWAMKNGPREKFLYVVTVQPNLEDESGDYLSVVDVDPESDTFCQVIHRSYAGRKGQEFHHIGWNTCSSCHSCGKNGPKRDKLVLPCLNSDAIFIFDVGADPKKPKLHKIIDGDVLRRNNVSAPHTAHCLADGNIMISTMGDAAGNALGDFILFDKDFECIGTWTRGDKKAICGYDFWYQPKFNLMVASEWGAPKIFRRGYEPADITLENDYGRRLNVYDWQERKLVDTIHLGDDGITPLEIRFLHNPNRCEGFVGACLNSKIFRFYKKNVDDEKLTCEKVIDCLPKKIEGGQEIGGMTSDILLSLDDRFLYFNNWMHGDVRQYDITNPAKPKLTGQLFLGGSFLNDSKVKVIEDKELTEQPSPVYVKGRRLEGGPQMLQLSLDGKRLYVSSSLYSPWDKQFYPEMVKKGGTIVQLDIDIENGGMKLNENFLVDFGNEPNGPSLPHEMRYPGGDCTSDIWLADD